MAVVHVREVGERGFVFAVPVAGDFDEGGYWDGSGGGWGEKRGGEWGRMHPRCSWSGKIGWVDGRDERERVRLGVVVGEGGIILESVFLEQGYGRFADLVQWRAISDGFLAGEVGGEVDAFLEDVGFLLFGHLVGTLYCLLIGSTAPSSK